MQSARDFVTDEDLKTEDILCVFRGLQTAQPGQKIQRSDAQCFALGLNAGDHLVAQRIDVGIDDELRLDPLVDTDIDSLGDKMIACIEAKREALGI